jgi:UDP-glucose 4-epimerase
MNLVTGSSGFIGSRLVAQLSTHGQVSRRLVRQDSGHVNEFVGNLLDPLTLRYACEGVRSVFHCAGHAHAFSSLANDDEALHWKVNFEGTRNLIEAAGEAGVKNFVFLSSVKAMGEPGEACVDEEYSVPPSTAYGRSKLAAEKAVLEAGGRYGMCVVNLRLSMVYGADGRGNLERMARLVKRGLFPPLPESGNHRSLVHVDDVVDVIRLVSSNDLANGRTYIVASREAPSGRALFDAIRAIQGMPKCRWAVPEFLLRSAGTLGDGLQKVLRRRMPVDSEVIDRLLGSAWYSSACIENELGWRARVSLVDGLAEMIFSIGRRPAS